MPELFIGCSGFAYPHWRGRFYPDDLPRKGWFSHYCAFFATVELNVTFYRLLKPETFAHWQRESPPGFAFSLKGSRFITHVKRLTDPGEPLQRFFAGGLLLAGKLRVILWQFPPDFARDMERLAHFLECLRRYPPRNALEFRHESWLTEEVLELCRRNNVALCLADWPPFIDSLPLTADFVYLRRHGLAGRYSSCYTSEELAADARRIRGYLADGRDVYIYFNNDFEGHAPANAMELSNLLHAGC